MREVESLAQRLSSLRCDVLIGSGWHDGVRTYNASILLSKGFVDVVRCKHELPNYGVFDEKRVFASGPLPKILSWRGIEPGIPDLRRSVDYYSADGTEIAARSGEITGAKSPRHIPSVKRVSVIR